MIHSMTGYGRAVNTLRGREITVELRSVNNRFLDCNVKLPRLFGYAEEAVKQKIKESVSRGKVDVFINIRNTGEEEVHIGLNKPVLEGYLKALRTMVEEYNVRDDVSTSTLARMPDIFVVEKQEEDEAQNVADILSVAQEAINAYNLMRQTEGAAMEADLRRRAATILSYVEPFASSACEMVAGRAAQSRDPAGIPPAFGK